MTDGKITYHQQVTFCGKPRCRKCREGVGHGPYWYAYRTVEGQTTRTYIGKSLPPDVQATLTTPAPPPVPRPERVTPPPVSTDPPQDLTTVRLLTLGQFRLERRTLATDEQATWQVVNDVAWQQRQESSLRALLAYLICSAGRRASRAQIQAALWAELDNETATRRLNKTIQQLQKVLGLTFTGEGEVRVGELAVQNDGEWIILAGQGRLYIDADDFANRLAQSTTGSDENPPDALNPVKREQQLREALALYSGDFLPEERTATWVSTRRQELRRGWSELQLALADMAMHRTAFSEAIDILNRLLAKDATNELAVQRLMMALAHLKRRVEALRVYQHFAGVLQREYQALPARETQSLYEIIRRGGELPSTLETPGSSPRGGPTRDERNALLESIGRSAPAEIIGRAHLSPLVGRESDLDSIRTMLLQIEQGVHLQVVGQRKQSGIPLDTQRRPQCLLLMGDAGIGKTRLAEEMSREARQRGWAVIWSRLFTQESSVPYRVWIEALRKTLPLGSGLFNDLSPDMLQSLSVLLPELREAVPGAALEQASGPHGLSPEQEQVRLRDAIADWLKLIGENTPLLIVLDDIQWADSSSYSLFGHLARLLYGYPVMFVATCRDSELTRKPLHPLLDLVNHMQRERSITTRHVEPLTSEEIGMLVSNVSRLPETTVRHIQDQAAGNPFFAEELARSTPPSLPRTVVAALDNRLNRLSESCRQILRNAAVLGGTFEFGHICAMEGSPDEGDANELADEDIVLTLLEEALQAGVLTDEGAGTQILYHFWHPLLVSRLYEQLSALRRARLHRRAADVFIQLSRGRAEEVAATITDHLVKGDAEPTRIAQYAELAGNRAYAVFAYPEAEQHYRLATERLPRTRRESDPAHLASLLERLAECVLIQGHFAEARQHYERVLELRGQLQQIARGGPGQSEDQMREAQIQALLQVEIGLAWNYTGDYRQAWQCCERAELILRQTGAGVIDGPGWARLYHLQGMLHRQEGRYEEAMQRVQEAIELYERQQRRLPTRSTPGAAGAHNVSRIQRTLEGDPINLGRAHRLVAAIAEPMGQFSRVLEHQGKALALYEQYNEPRQIGHLTCDIGYAHIKKGEYEPARLALERAFNLAQRVGDMPLLQLVTANMGELAEADGDLEQAERYYRHALEQAEARNEDRDYDYISRWNARLAAIVQALGKLDEAAICVRRAWNVARSIHSTPCLAQALVALGSIRIAQAIMLEKNSAGTPRLMPYQRNGSHRENGAIMLPGVATGIELNGNSAKTLSLNPTRDKQARRLRLLSHARIDLEQVLAQGQLVDVETTVRSRLALAHVSFLQGKREEARTQLQQIILDAQSYELAQVVVRARELMEQVNG
jgi:tetratricopeptide (TPR) repeat protein